MTCAVFYVGHLWWTDMAVGLEAGRLLRERGIEAVELSGDALAMVADIQAARPRKAILMGAAARGRPKGTVEAYRFTPYAYRDAVEAQDALRPSLEGRISLEDLLRGLSVLGTPAEEVYVVECEPPVAEPGIGLSPQGRRCAEELAAKVEEIYKEMCLKISKIK